jgi:hypothetical protein
MKHKTIFNLFILVFTFCVSANAQSTYCPTVNAFIGEWRYVNGQDTIKVYLRTKDYTITYPNSPSSQIAVIWGWHEYKKGNVVIESNYSDRFIALPTDLDNYNEDNYSIFLTLPQCNTSLQKLMGNIDDLSQCREMKVVTINYNSLQNQLVWSQRDSEGYGFLNGCKGMTLPSNFVLTKL